VPAATTRNGVAALLEARARVDRPVTPAPTNGDLHRTSIAARPRADAGGPGARSLRRGEAADRAGAHARQRESSGRGGEPGPRRPGRVADRRAAASRGRRWPRRTWVEPGPAASPISLKPRRARLWSPLRSQADRRPVAAVIPGCSTARRTRDRASRSLPVGSPASQGTQSVAEVRVPAAGGQPRRWGSARRAGDRPRSRGAELPAAAEWAGRSGARCGSRSGRWPGGASYELAGERAGRRGRPRWAGHAAVVRCGLRPRVVTGAAGAGLWRYPARAPVPPASTCSASGRSWSMHARPATTTQPSITVTRLIWSSRTSTSKARGGRRGDRRIARASCRAGWWWANAVTPVGDVSVRDRGDDRGTGGVRDRRRCEPGGRWRRGPVPLPARQPPGWARRRPPRSAQA